MCVQEKVRLIEVKQNTINFVPQKGQIKCARNSIGKNNVKRRTRKSC